MPYLRADHVPLQFRSYYSFLRGCLSPDDICRFAKSNGYTAVGMADLNNFYGLIRFLQTAVRWDVKPIVGVTVAPGNKPWFTAYVRSRKGFTRINAILTSLHLDLQKKRGGYDPAQDLLDRGWEGLMVVSGNPGLLQCLSQRDRKGLYMQLTYQKSFHRRLQWARRLNLPVVAANPAYYLNTRDRPTCDLLRAIDLNVPVDEIPVSEITGSGRMAARREQMEGFFSAVPEALSNTGHFVTEGIAGELLNPEPVFPRFQDYSEQEAYRRLRALCLTGVHRRYGDPLPEIRKRLDYELGIIRDKRFAGYFLVVHDIVCRYPRTCGRGSAASSLVSYALGITHVDPIRYDLFFERFLNPGRKDPPDIDVDFPWDERNKVFEYVFKTYPERSAMVANHVTFGPRASIRETAKALGAGEEEINRFVRLWGVRRESQIPEHIRNPAERIRGMPRYLGTHCGGIVITPRETTHYVHWQRSNQGYPVIAWDKDATEAAGLVKIDLLGNRSLSVLRDTLETVRAHREPRLTWDSTHYVEDAATREMIEDADTVGIFYIESPATRQLLKKMRKADYEALVAATSIIRPAARCYLRWYVDRLHGKPYRELHPLFDGVLRETFGIMVYQEDVSRVAVSVAGFSTMEADRLRKVLERSDRELWLPELKRRFFSAGRGRGVGDESLRAMWEMILSFRGYSFCKPHSASYALVSYKLAYLKRHFPLEFIVSVMNNGGGYYSRQTYLDAARRMGFPIYGPDVNRSSELCAPEDHAVRMGLRFLKELPEKDLKRILDERRRNGPFLDVVDFHLRTSCGFPSMSLLIRSGSLDSLSSGLSRPQQFWVYLSARHRQDLFQVPPVPAYIETYSPQRRLMEEAKTLGLIISCHPIDLFRGRIAEAVARGEGRFFISSREIPIWVGRNVTLAGLLVTGKEARTRKDEDMIFLSFEDAYSLYETVLFPQVFRRYYRILNHMAVYLIGGKVVNEQGALIIQVLSLKRLCRDPDGEETAPVSARRRTRSHWLQQGGPRSAESR